MHRKPRKKTPVVARIAIAVALIIAAFGLGCAWGGRASAATSPIVLPSQPLTSPQLPGDVQAVFVPGSDGHARQARAGDRLVFRPAGAADTNEDLGPAGSDRLVSWYCHSKGPQRIRGWLCPHEGDWQALEMRWLPGGHPSGLCAGVARAQAGEYVTLQPCGRSANTLWITSGSDSPLVCVLSNGLLVLNVNDNGNEVLEQPNYGYGQMFSFMTGPWPGVLTTEGAGR